MDMAAPRHIKTTCPYCGVGCGVLAEVSGTGDVSVRGDPKPSGELRAPVLQGRGACRDDRSRRSPALPGGERRAAPTGIRRSISSPISSAQAIREHGPDSVAFYVSGQLLTEDYYVANKLMKGFIGSANIDTNSRLCMASSVAGHRRAFGSDTVPGCYEDLELADLIVLVGSNLAWCHPVLYQRIVAAKEKRPRMKVVLIDPRRTATADIADLHLADQAGRRRGAVPRAAAHLARSGTLKRRYISGAHDRLQGRAAVGGDARSRSTSCATPAFAGATLRAFLRAVRRDGESRHRLQPGRQPVVVGHRQGQRHHQLPSRDRPHRQARHGPVLGDGPAQRHGRTRGRRACQHARRPHEHRGRGASRPRAALLAARRPSRRSPGLKAVDMFRAVADGRIKALWIMATNPVVSMPEADNVEAAIRNCPFVVVSDVTARNRHGAPRACAPAGRRLGREERHRHQLGAAHLAPADLPHAAGRRAPRLVDHQRGGEPHGPRRRLRLFGAGGNLRRARGAVGVRERWGARFRHRRAGTIDAAGFEDLEPFQWPRAEQAQPAERMFADGRFFTPDGKARFVDVQRTRPRAQPSQASR